MAGCICRRSRMNAASNSTSTTSAEVFKRTPYIADLKPGGPLYRQGPLRCRRRAGADEGRCSTAAISTGDCLTVTGRTIAENLRDVKFPTNQDVRPSDQGARLSPTGGVVGLKGNLAPQGAIVKVAGNEQPQVPRAGALLRSRGGRPFACVERRQ